MIGKMRSKITLQSWGNVKDIGGGSTWSITSTWDIRALVENRTGRAVFNADQSQWDYDYKITFRYEESRPVKSTNTILYQGKTLKIESLSVQDEGKIKFMIARCSTIDNNV